HPIHLHLEHFQTLKRSGDDCAFRGGGAGISAVRPNVPKVEVSRKDTYRLQFNEDVTVFQRFRDFVGDWPMHCHNTLHEDHAMMLIFQVRPGVIENNKTPKQGRETKLEEAAWGNRTVGPTLIERSKEYGKDDKEIFAGGCRRNYRRCRHNPAVPSR